MANPVLAKLIKENEELEINIRVAKGVAADLRNELARAQSELAGQQTVVRRMTAERDAAVHALEKAHAEYGAQLAEASRILSLVRVAWMGQAPDYITDVLQFLERAK